MSSLRLPFESRRDHFTLPENWDRSLSFLAQAAENVAGQRAVWLNARATWFFLLTVSGK